MLVSGTKKLFLKWIRRALRQKRIEVPDRNGPVRWTLAHSFFRVSENGLEEEIHSPSLASLAHRC